MRRKVVTTRKRVRRRRARKLQGEYRALQSQRYNLRLTFPVAAAVDRFMDAILDSTGVDISQNQALTMLIVAGVEQLAGESVANLVWQMEPRKARGPKRRQPQLEDAA
jgi:hypothetical protein